MFSNEIRNDIYTQTSYSKKIGVSVPYVNKLIKQGKVKLIEINGAKLIKI